MCRGACGRRYSTEASVTSLTFSKKGPLAAVALFFVVLFFVLKCGHYCVKRAKRRLAFRVRLAARVTQFCASPGKITANRVVRRVLSQSIALLCRWGVRVGCGLWRVGTSASRSASQFVCRIYMIGLYGPAWVWGLAFDCMIDCRSLHPCEPPVLASGHGFGPSISPRNCSAPS